MTSRGGVLEFESCHAVGCGKSYFQEDQPTFPMKFLGMLEAQRPRVLSVSGVLWWFHCCVAASCERCRVFLCWSLRKSGTVRC